MRAILILAAVCSLPLAAVAQPTPESGLSREVSELVDQARKATTVSELVVSGCSMPADSEGKITGLNYEEGA